MQKKKSHQTKIESRSIDSFSALATELNLNESYKSLLLGIAVVLLAAVLVIGYAKNRNTKNMATVPVKQQMAMKAEKKPEVIGMHTVETGNDLKTISMQYYETPDLFLTIAKANGITNPDVIDEGKKLNIPKIDKQQFTPSLVTTASTQPITDTSYTVQEGDLLWNIAVRAYKDGYKWKDIMATNNLQSPDAIFSGMILQLPR